MYFNWLNIMVSSYSGTVGGGMHLYSCSTTGGSKMQQYVPQIVINKNINHTFQP